MSSFSTDLADMSTWTCWSTALLPGGRGPTSGLKVDLRSFHGRWDEQGVRRIIENALGCCGNKVLWFKVDEAQRDFHSRGVPGPTRDRS